MKTSRDLQIAAISVGSVGHLWYALQVLPTISGINSDKPGEVLFGVLLIVLVLGFPTHAAFILYLNRAPERSPIGSLAAWCWLWLAFALGTTITVVFAGYAFF